MKITIHFMLMTIKMMIRYIKIIGLVALLGWQNTALAADDAVMVEAFYIGEVVKNLGGGDKKASQTLGTADLSITVDTEGLGLWQGGTWFAEVIYNHGDDPSNFIGDVQTASNIADGKRKRLQQFWYDHALNDNVSLLLGLHDLNSEFYASEYAALFLNSSLGIGPEVSGNVGTSLWPEAGLAARLSLHNVQSYVNVVIYDGDPATRKVDKATEGLMMIIEAGWLNGEAAYKFGLWQHSAEKAGPDNIASPSVAGFYAVVDQPLSENTGVFMQLGLTQANRNEIANYFGAGLVMQEPISGRSDDTLGLAVARAGFSNTHQQANGVLAAETAIEITYDMAITDWLTVHPAYQWIHHPSGNPALKNANVAMLRVDIHLP